MKQARLTGAGKFIHPLTVEQNTGTTTDDNGKRLEEWTVFAEPFGRVTYLSGDDAILLRQRRPSATHEVELYSESVKGMTEKMRIIHDGRVFFIEEISDADAGELKAICHEAK